MVTPQDLEAQIDAQLEQLQLLLELTTQQEAAIDEGRMNELMQVLSQKQRLVEGLVHSSETLRVNRETFTSSPEISATHRERSQLCNRLHLELLQREENCQSSLSVSRNKIAEELAQGEGTRRAAAGYRQSPLSQSSGGSTLDLSSGT